MVTNAYKITTSYRHHTEIRSYCICQNAAYTQHFADLHHQYKKYIHKRPKHILL